MFRRMARDAVVHISANWERWPSSRRNSVLKSLFANHADVFLSWRRAHREPERHADHHRCKNGHDNLFEIHLFQSVCAQYLEAYHRASDAVVTSNLRAASSSSVLVATSVPRLLRASRSFAAAPGMCCEIAARGQRKVSAVRTITRLMRPNCVGYGF